MLNKVGSPFETISHFKFLLENPIQIKVRNKSCQTWELKCSSCSKYSLENNVGESNLNKFTKQTLASIKTESNSTKDAFKMLGFYTLFLLPPNSFFHNTTMWFYKFWSKFLIL